MRKQDIPVQIMDIPFPETADIERRVLADVATCPEYLGDIVPLMHEDFFTNDLRRRIWRKIAADFNVGNAIDLTTLNAAFGKQFVDEVLPMTSRYPGYSEMLGHVVALRNGAACRRGYFAGVQFLQQITNPSSGEQDILAAVEGFAAQVEGPAPMQNEVTLAEAVQLVRDSARAAEKAAAEGRTTRIPTGFTYLDRAINSGFKPGQLVVIAARPGVGKTSVMLHLAKTAARAGNPVYISTLEMTNEEFAEKFLFSTGRVRPAELSRGAVDWMNFGEAQGELEGLPILINQFSRTLDQIVGRITQAVKRGKCDIAFIDYLGLMQDCTTLNGNAKLYQIVGKVTATLKLVAKRLGIPIVLLCQLNRDAVRNDRAPELYDLRDSGSIEQDADIVLILAPQKNEKTIIAWLRKNRGGRKVDSNGEDIGFKLLPNETYSAFTELGPVSGEDMDLPEAVTTPKEERNNEIF